MKVSNLIVTGLMGIVLTAGFSGCIFSTSPGTSNVIEMSPGETKVFKVSGTALNTATSKCEWSIDRRNGNPPEVVEGIDQVEYTLNPEGENSNKVRITCTYYRYLYTFGAGPGPGLILDWYWVPVDSRTWNIRILRNTEPTWQGDYNIDDSADLQFLNGYTGVTGHLRIIDSNIKNLNGLENITSVGGDTRIEFNGVLMSLDGLKNLAEIGGDLFIIWNDALTSLTGLENLSSIGRGLIIYYDSALTSLSGLENLESIGAALHISHNDELTVLGMTGLQKTGEYFWINYNDSLCTSLAEELMNQVLAGGGIGGERSIEGNKDCSEQ